MKLDILAIVAHPDDVELGCSGILLSHIARGKKAGIIDFTQGELGTRGTPETRLKEAEEASKRMGLSARENLGFADGFFTNDKEHQLELIRYIRKYRPEIVITNSPVDRHPDHGKASQLTIDACFLSGLRKISTACDGKEQEEWRPKQIYHFVQSTYLEPDFIVDVSDVWEQKVAAIEAYESQFHVEGSKSNEPETFISTPEFMDFIVSRARSWGQAIGAKYGEGLIAHQKIGIKNLFDIG